MGNATGQGQMSRSFKEKRLKVPTERLCRGQMFLILRVNAEAPEGHSGSRKHRPVAQAKTCSALGDCLLNFLRYWKPKQTHFNTSGPGARQRVEKRLSRFI